MLLNTRKISLIYSFSKLSHEETYQNDVNQLSRKLIHSETTDAANIQRSILNLIRLIQLWDQRVFDQFDRFYEQLLKSSLDDNLIDALLRFLYDIELYDAVKYLVEKNVEYYKNEKVVSSTMNGFHEAAIYGFSHVCRLYLDSKQEVNEPFSLIYKNPQTNKKEKVRNLTALQMVCLWSKYFPKRISSYSQTVRLLLDHGARVNMVSTELTTALHWACQMKHTFPIAENLIEAGAQIRVGDRINLQPIHYAAWSKNRPLIDLLIQKGARLTDQDDLGRTPLHFVCLPMSINFDIDHDQQQQFDLMKYLLSHRDWLNLKQQDFQGYGLISYACMSKNGMLMELLLENEPDLIDENGRTILVMAINMNFVDGVKIVLRSTKFNRNSMDQDGNTPFHHACMNVNGPHGLEIVQLLMDDRNGRFDLERRNNQSHDPLMLSVIHQSLDLFSLLIERDVSLTKIDLHGRQVLHIACQMGLMDFVSQLIKSTKININAIDDFNRNCLFYAISHGDVHLVDLLIENHVDIEVRDSIGDTPLHLAVQHKTFANELTRCLLKTDDGKKLINVPAADGMKPILLATINQQSETIRTLIEYGADPNVSDSEERNALHLACKSNAMKIVVYLVETLGFDVNSVDCYQQTAMFYAFTTNNSELVRYLIKCGARLDVRDYQNYLPLHVGILSSNEDDDFNIEFIEMYKETDSTLIDDNRNESEMTPLILASMKGRLNLVEYLLINCNVNCLTTCSNGHSALHYACLRKNKNSLKLIEFLIHHGCDLNRIDQPTGSFFYTIIQYGDRSAMRFFVDRWLKSQSNINELHYGATILDLLFQRAQLYQDDLDIEFLRHLIEHGATLYSSDLSQCPYPLVNDCPSFYRVLLEYNKFDQTSFVLHLLNSISVYDDDHFRFSSQSISVCKYFLDIFQLAQQFYTIDNLYSIVMTHFIPNLRCQQTTDVVDQLENRLNEIHRIPMKLSEIIRKSIRRIVPMPRKDQWKKLELCEHLGNFLDQRCFREINELCAN